jgi:hypothetical protein
MRCAVNNFARRGKVFCTPLELWRGISRREIPRFAWNDGNTDKTKQKKKVKKKRWATDGQRLGKKGAECCALQED